MTRRSCRVYFCAHDDGTRSGTLLSRSNRWFRPPDPSAYANDEDGVLHELEVQLARRVADQPGELDLFLWEEELQTAKLHFEVPLLTGAHGRFVIGKRKVPLQVTYAYGALPGGSYRVLAPRFDVELVVEELALAPDLLRHALTELLLGEDPRQVYDLRSYRDEYIRSFTPRMLRRRGEALGHHADAQRQTALRQCADELVAQARAGRLASVMGEPPTVAALVASDDLVPTSILLVGPSGVGKSAWVRGLAQRLARPQGRGLARKVWSTSPDRIVAGLPYLGQWQARCLALVDELSFEGDLLHLDRLASIVQPIYDEASVADFLDDPMKEGFITVIAEATPEELDLARRIHPTFVSHFQVVRIDEPTAADAIALLETHAERRGGSKLHALSYKRLFRHLDVFARESALPGKALRFLDWLSANPQADLPSVLHPSDVSRAYARYSGVPHALLADDQPKSRQEFARELAARVIGQDGACDVAARALARLKAAMVDPARPSASFLFVGPTGVGKTELAKQLAIAGFGSEARLVRFDMSEFMYPGSATRLLDPSTSARSLVTEVRRQPLSLILLDEIEKADPHVLDLLLSALDEGRVTDSLGRLSDLRSTMIVMTSNLGVRDRPSVGFGGADDTDSLRAVRAAFRPELWNRIDYVVPFRALSLEDMARIVHLELGQINERDGMKQRRVRISASERAVTALARAGHNPLFGARPMKRLIEEKVVAKIAARLAAEPELRDQLVAVVTEGETADGWVVLV